VRSPSLVPNRRTADRVVSLAGECGFLRGEPKLGDHPGLLSPLKFSDTIHLPGTTDTNQKGPASTERSTYGLTQRIASRGRAGTSVKSPSRTSGVANVSPCSWSARNTHRSGWMAGQSARTDSLHAAGVRLAAICRPARQAHHRGGQQTSAG